MMEEAWIFGKLQKIAPAPQEHLEPEPGAMLMFQGMPDDLKQCEGYRWQLKDKYPNWTGILFYYLRRVEDCPDDLATYLRADQEIMDRCGRLLISGPGEEQAG